MITKNIRKEVVTQSDRLMINWNDEAWCPEMAFFFGDTMRTYLIETAEDLGAIIAVLTGAEEEKSFCKHTISVKHVFNDGNTPFAGEYEFMLAAGSGDGCRMEKRTVMRYRINAYEGLVLERALSSMCERMLSCNRVMNEEE